MRRFLLLIVGLVVASCGGAAQAQTPCPPSSNSNSFSVYSVSYYPVAFPVAGAGFQVNAQVCPLTTTNTYFTAQVTIVNSAGMTVFSEPAVCDTINGSLAAYSNGLPAGYYTLSITAPSPFMNYSTTVHVNSGPLAALSGQYSYFFKGISATPPPAGTSSLVAFAGAFTADGNGNIISGEEDFNSPRGAMEQLPVTGSYTLDQNGDGSLTLTTAAGSQSFTFSYGNAIGAFTSTGTGPYVGTGSLEFSNLTGPGSGQNSGQFVLQLRGETACNAACVEAGNRALPTTGSGVISVNGGAYTGSPGSGYTATFDETFGTNVLSGFTESGNVGNQDSNGRIVLTRTTSTTSGSPQRYALYFTPYGGHYLFSILSLDPHDRAPLVTGSIFDY